MNDGLAMLRARVMDCEGRVRETVERTVGDVFIPGGLPTVTYVPRASRNLEQRVREYVAERHRILSVTGPSKSGKTVLLKSILDASGSIWLSGGRLESGDLVWSTLADALRIPTETASTMQSSTSSGSHLTAGGGFAPAGIGGRAERTRLQSTDTQTGESQHRARNIAEAVREELLRRTVPIVVDDFHYIAPPVQTTILRSFKDLVFEGVPLILVSVTHRADDPVRAERELAGRVELLEIEPWSSEELEAIAGEGFAALGAIDEASIGATLAAESFQNPHLMQAHCLSYSKSAGLVDTQNPSVTLRPPASWDEFFRARVFVASRPTFEVLARSADGRINRYRRSLPDGSTANICEAILLAIASTGPKTQLTLAEIMTAMRSILPAAGVLPQRRDITHALSQMAAMARTQAPGDLVVDYSVATSTFTIADPFFANYLRWAVRPANSVS